MADVAPEFEWLELQSEFEEVAMMTTTTEVMGLGYDVLVRTVCVLRQGFSDSQVDVSLIRVPGASAARLRRKVGLDDKIA